MEQSIINIEYHNPKKDETTKRTVFVTKELKDVKGAILGFDLSGLEESEVDKLTEAYAAYQEKYYTTVPSFEEYLEAENLSVEPKWRRFLKENTKIIE